MTDPRHPDPDQQDDAYDALLGNGALADGKPLEGNGAAQLLKVSEVGRRTGLTRKALRHYESMGLVEPAVRTASGYRLYDDEALRRIELVNRAKVLGLSLVEAKEFLHVAEGCCGENHPELSALVEHKLAETDARLAELGSLRKTLSEVLERLARTEGQHRCEESLCTCNTPLTIGRRNQPTEA